MIFYNQSITTLFNEIEILGFNDYYQKKNNSVKSCNDNIIIKEQVLEPLFKN